MKKTSYDYVDIAVGDRVEMLVPAGGRDYTAVRGRVVMRGDYGWVLNLGGPHGRPGVCSPVNFVRIVRKARRG